MRQTKSFSAALALAAALPILVSSPLHAGSSLPLSSGLEAYYQFDGTGVDAGPGGLDLTLFNSVGFEPGLIGQALAPNGVNSDYAARTVDDASLDFGTGEFTIQAWVNFNNTSGEQVLLEKFTGAQGPGWSFTKLADNRIAFVTDNGAVPLVQSAPLSLSLDTWNHFVARRTGNTYEIFLNNSGVALVNASPTENSASAASLLIGRRNADDNRDFAVEGSLDEIAIWSRALGNDEVSALYNSGSGYVIAIPEPGTVSLLAGAALALWLGRRTRRIFHR